MSLICNFERSTNRDGQKNREKHRQQLISYTSVKKISNFKVWISGHVLPCFKIIYTLIPSRPILLNQTVVLIYRGALKNPWLRADLKLHQSFGPATADVHVGEKKSYFYYYYYYYYILSIQILTPAHFFRFQTNVYCFVTTSIQRFSNGLTDSQAVLMHIFCVLSCLLWVKQSLVPQAEAEVPTLKRFWQQKKKNANQKLNYKPFEAQQTKNARFTRNNAWARTHTKNLPNSINQREAQRKRLKPNILATGIEETWPEIQTYSLDGCQVCQQWSKRQEVKIAVTQETTELQLHKIKASNQNWFFFCCCFFANQWGEMNIPLRLQTQKNFVDWL